MKNIFTSIKMFLILLLLPSYSLHAQAVTYPVNKPGLPDQPYFISYSDDAMEPFSDAVPSDNSPVAPAQSSSSRAPRRELGGFGSEDNPGTPEPIGAPWVLMLLAVGYAAFKFYGKRRLAVETVNESNMKNTSIMKKINDKIRSSFSTRIAALLLMLITMSVGQVWGRYYDGTEYLYFNAGAVSWWCNGSAIHIACFDATGDNNENTGTKVIGEVVSEKIYRFLVPAGNYTTVKFTRNESSESGSGWNHAGRASLDATKNYVSSFTENATSFSWSTYAPPAEYTIYFKNTLGWSNVYVHFYNSATSFSSGNGCSGSNAAKNCGAMTSIDGTYYRLTYTGSPYSYVCFTKDQQDSYGNFWNTEASYAAGLDLSSANVLWKPNSTPVTPCNSCSYYNSGTWTTYPESSPCDKTPVFTMQSNVNDAVTNVAKSISVTGTSNCASYQWSVASPNASSASFSAATSATTNFTATAAGTYTVKMTATSDCGKTTEKTCTITVSAAANNITVYYSNPNNWSALRAHVWNNSTKASRGTWENDNENIATTVVRNCTTYYYTTINLADYDRVLFYNKNNSGNKTDDLPLDAGKDGKYYDGTSWNALPTNTEFSVNCASGTGYTITNLQKKGSAYTSGTKSVVCGDVITFTVNPTVGYSITSVKVGGADVAHVGANYTYTTSGTSDVTVNIVATALPSGYLVNFDACSSGNGSVVAKIGGESISSGSRQAASSVVTFTATPNPGYYLRGWYSNADGAHEHLIAYATNASNYQYAVTLDANKTLYAKFEAIPSGIKLAGNFYTGESDWTCVDADNYSNGVYTWAFPSHANNNKEFVFKASSCPYEALIKHNTNGMTYSSTGCMVGKASSNDNFGLTNENKILLFTLTYGSGIHVQVDANDPSCTPPTISWATAPADGTAGGNMTATVTKNDAGATVTWESSNTSVATVSSTGVITYVSAGTATITAKYTGSGAYCSTLASVNKSITVTATTAIYAYLGVQFTLPATGVWASNNQNVLIADGKLTGKALGDYIVTCDGNNVLVHVYQYYIKHPWSAGGGSEASWVWKAMTIKNGLPTYTGAAGDAGANIAWSVEDKDGTTEGIGGSNWISSISYSPSYTQGNVYDFVYDPGVAINGSTAPVNNGTLTAKEVNVETTTITFAAQTFTVSGAAGSEGGSVRSTAGVSGSAIVRNSNVTFTAEANDGYTFEGWYSEAACTNLVSDKASYTATMTGETYAIYAKFQQKPALSVKIGSGSYNAMTDNGNGSFTYVINPQSPGSYTYTVKVDGTTKEQSDSYTVTVNSKVTITAVYNGYSELMTISVVVEPTGQVVTTWYMIGNPYWKNSEAETWTTSNTNFPLDRLYRATEGVYYRQTTFAIGTQYFRVHNTEKQFGYCGQNENKTIPEGYSSAATLNYCSTIQSNLMHNGAETVYVIVDTREASETDKVKVWFERELPICHSILVTNGVGGTYTVKTASGFTTTQIKEGEKYNVVVTPEAGRRVSMTVDGQEVELTADSKNGTFTYTGTMQQVNQSVVINYTEPQDITVTMHVACADWQGRTIKAQYKNDGGSWTKLNDVTATALPGYDNWVTYTFPKENFTGGLVQFSIDLNSPSNNNWSDQIALTQFDDSYCYELACEIAGQGRKLTKCECPSFGVKVVVANGDEIGSTATLSAQTNVSGEVTYRYYYSKNGADFVEINEVDGAYTYTVLTAGKYQYKVSATYAGETVENVSKEIEVKPATLTITPSATAISSVAPITLTPMIANVASGTRVTLCFSVKKDGEDSSVPVNESAGIYTICLSEVGAYTIHAELKMGDDCDGDAIATAETEIQRGTLEVSLAASNTTPKLGETITLTTTVTGGTATNYRFTVKSSTEPMPKIIANNASSTKTFEIATEETFDFTVTATVDGRNYTASCSVTAGAKTVYINYPWDGGAMPDDVQKKEMTYAGDGVYTYYVAGESKFQGEIANETYLEPVSGRWEDYKGTKVTFTYNSTTGKVSFVETPDAVESANAGDSPNTGLYLRHGWTNGSWHCKALVRNGSTDTYSCVGVMGNTDSYQIRNNGVTTEFKFNALLVEKSSTGAYIWSSEKKFVGPPTLIDLTTGQDEGKDAIFSYNINRNELTIMNANTTLNRIKSDNGKNGTFYSNEILTDGQVSFYASPSSVLTWQTFSKDNTTSWSDAGAVMNTVAEGDIYVADATISSHSLSNVSAYTGTYYIYSQLTGLDEATIETPASGKKKAKMTQFDNISDDEFYNHYWVEWITGGDAYATVGNKINRNVSRILPSYTLPGGTNLRYAFNPETNYFGRSFLAGSGGTFLQLYGSNVYKESPDDTELNGSDNSHRQNFTDGSSWVYTAVVRGVKPAEMKIVANYNGTEYYLLSKDGDPNATRTLLGASSTTGTDKLTFQITYDYKFNRIIAGWKPDNQTIENPFVVDADIFFVRKEQTPMSQFVVTGDGKVESLKQVMFVLELNRDVETGKEVAYWISLPFDCKVSEIFGVPGYMDVWGIQRYNGKRRAQEGWMSYSQNFWEWVGKEETLKKGEGYVLFFDKKSADWKDIGGKSYLNLYFPSSEKGFVMSPSSLAEPIQYDSLPCNVKNRRAKDSNWHLIGPNGYTDISIGDFERWQNDSVLNEAPHFLYEYTPNTWNDVTGYYTATDATAGGFKYRAFFSYMVQFCGTVNWTQYTQSQKQNVAARVISDRPFRRTAVRLSLNNENGDTYDRTFVHLDCNGKTAFEDNKDLTKIVDNRASQIYSVTEGEAYAGNTLPLETDTVALTINAAAAGDYVISLPEQNSDVEPMLYDAEMGMTTPLNLLDYTITLSKGTHTGRFFLILGRKTPGVATDIETMSPSDLNLPTDMTQKLLINGEVYLLRDGHIYDATGRRVR